MRRGSWGTRWLAWLAHEAKGQRADKLSRGVGVSPMRSSSDSGMRRGEAASACRGSISLECDFL